MTIRVWAPNSKNVMLNLPGRKVRMRPHSDGWWSASIRDQHPVDYSIILDGGQPLPDPRSGWQPFGVHGPSRTVDHAAFRWSDSAWQAPPLSAALFYELHVGTFTPEGTFDAAISRIPHLVDLGITHVELMPVNDFPGEWGWGYDGVDVYAPHQAYGGPEGLKRLVDALHANGLAAVLDVVYNHLGPSGNYLGQFGPYFNDRLKTPWGDAVNLGEAHSGEVRRFFIDNAVMWLRDYHFDGLRLDAVHALLDTSATHFLEELAGRIERLEAELGRHLLLIAESDLNDPRLLRPREIGGYGLAAQWSDDFHHALHTVLTGEGDGYYCDFGSIAQLAKALESGFVYDGCYSEYRSRVHGRPLGDVPLYRLLGYIQNHDQIGNRALGERITHLISPERARIAAALVMMSPFVPMLFQGEEWAASTPFQYFTNHQEPGLGQAVSEGRRREFERFGWPPESVPDPQDAQTFQRSKLKWEEASEQPHAAMLAWYRHLISLRRSASELRSARAQATYSEEDRWLVLDRGAISVACNFGREPCTAPLRTGHEVALSSGGPIEYRDGAILLPPDSVAIAGDPRVTAGVRASAEKWVPMHS
jgi:maltooligosyltrehalose trehalohydrolase